MATRDISSHGSPVDAAVVPRDSELLDIQVGGMTCGACATRLQKALSRASGVHAADVNFATERARVQFDASQTGIGAIADAVVRAGFEVPEERNSFGVSGMTCSACATRIEKALRRVPGVVAANVNLALERADVTSVAGKVQPQALAEAVAKAGYQAQLRSDTDTRAKADADFQRQQAAKLERESRMLLISIALTLPFIAQMVSTFVGWSFHMHAAMEVALATPVQFVIGARFYKGAYNALRARSGNMDVLVVMGTSAAYIYSYYLLGRLGTDAQGQLYFEASAVIITLVLLGKFLEARTKRGTTAAIRQLMDLRPETAHVLRDGGEIELSVADVCNGDLIIVRPGERIPVDGIVTEGTSEIDESLITGESLPVAKQAGDPVTGGAINGTGLLTVRATAVGEDSTLSKIIRLVENAQAGKAPVQRLVDRISEIFVPTVVAIATVTFVAWMLVSGNLEQALLAAVSVLVIACPCALGLATPTAIMTGTGVAARHGILIKDVESLESAHRINAVIFDKTGTLTQGRPSVVGSHLVAATEPELLTVAASLQQGSEHPLASAVLARAREDDLSLHAIEAFQSHTGRGVSGQVAGADVLIGNAAFMAENDIEVSANSGPTADWESQGKTVIWVARSGQLLGSLAIADSLRPESAPAIQELKAMKIKTLLISGDAIPVAEEIGRQVGVDTTMGGVKPDDKAQEVEKLASEGYWVGMIGDGINDAPALAAADVGIAMGTGTDIAMETAGVTLMRPDPRLVAAAISVSRATWNKIRQNLFWAFIYNVIGIPLAALGMLSPAIAGAAMAMSSVSVVSISLLLKRWKPKRTKQP